MAKNITKRAKSVSDVLQYKPKPMAFEDEWADSFGQPELGGTWLIWGNSGNGKTRFALQLAKYLTRFGKVAYNSIEEGLTLSMQRAFKETGMGSVGRRLVLLDREPIPELTRRLMQRKSPDIVFIDSIQYTGMNYSQYKTLRDNFRDKLFIFISHADGKEPAGRVAKSVRFDAHIKIRVEGYKVPKPVSRYGGGAEFVIFKKGAEEYWKTKTNN